MISVWLIDVIKESEIYLHKITICDLQRLIVKLTRDQKGIIDITVLFQNI